MGKNKKGLSAGWIVAIVIGGIAIVSGITVGVLALNGVFDEKEEYVLPSGSGGGVLKPIVYIYPEVETEVSVKLGAPEKLSVSYPSYDGGWKVLAKPNGKLTDLKTDRELYSLYWEGEDGSFVVTNEGFVVKGEEAADFLEEKLALLGLTEREAEEFIVYWLPRMQENSYNYVRFASSEEIEEYMPLVVSPKPDTTIRIAMVLSALEEPIELEEQVLPAKPERSGFTVVEWGGSVIK